MWRPQICLFRYCDAHYELEGAHDPQPIVSTVNVNVQAITSEHPNLSNNIIEWIVTKAVTSLLILSKGMPPRNRRLESHIKRPSVSINTQAEVELVFQIHCLYAVVGDSGVNSLLQGIRSNPHHDFTNLVSDLLEVCSEYFDRVNPWLNTSTNWAVTSLNLWKILPFVWVIFPGRGNEKRYLHRSHQLQLQRRSLTAWKRPKLMELNQGGSVLTIPDGRTGLTSQMLRLRTLSKSLININQGIHVTRILTASMRHW